MGVRGVAMMCAMGWLATLCCMSAGVCWVTCGQGAKPAKLGWQVVVREGRGRRASRRGGCFRHCVRELAPSAPYATTAGAQSPMTWSVTCVSCERRTTVGHHSTHQDTVTGGRSSALRGLGLLGCPPVRPAVKIHSFIAWSSPLACAARKLLYTPAKASKSRLSGVDGSVRNRLR